MRSPRDIPQKKETKSYLRTTNVNVLCIVQWTDHKGDTIKQLYYVLFTECKETSYEIEKLISVAQCDIHFHYVWIICWYEVSGWSSTTCQVASSLYQHAAPENCLFFSHMTCGFHKDNTYLWRGHLHEKLSAFQVKHTTSTYCNKLW